MSIQNKESSLPPTVRIGRAGPMITRVGFGAWAIGGSYSNGWGPTEDSTSHSAILRAIDRGINWIDTAPTYGLGHSETVIGRALRQVSADSRPYVFTKCGRTWNNGIIGSDLRPDSIRKQCEASLRRLTLDQIDLYQIHRPDHETGTPIEESWTSLAELVDKGKVRWIGVSNFDQELIERCEVVRPVESVQPRINLIDRSNLRLAQWCRTQGIGVLAYSPLASGMLADSFSHRRMASLSSEDWRSRSIEFTEPALSRNLGLVDQLRALAKDQGGSVVELALSWVLAQRGVTAAVVGARSPRQVDTWANTGRHVINRETVDLADQLTLPYVSQ